MTGAAGGALLGERAAAGTLLAERAAAGALLGERAAADVGAALDERAAAAGALLTGALTTAAAPASVSPSKTGTACQTALVRADFRAARTTSRSTFTSMSRGCILSAGLVVNVPTSQSSNRRTTE
jgi:hypothetical protein